LQYELAHFKGNMGHDATSDASLSMICLASKILCQLGTFFCFAAVLSTCCCARHVKEDDRVFQLFVLQRDK
jgi:hypothetical protein